MEQENKRFSNVLMSKDWIYLTVIFIILFILSVVDNNFVIPSIGLWFIMLFYSLRANGKKREEIEGYINNLTFNMDAQSKDTLLNFPLPMLTLELNGMIIWHNLLFQKIIGQSDLVEKYIYDFSEELKPENLIKNNKIVTTEVKIKGNIYKVLGNLVRTGEKNDKEHYTLSLYFIDVTDYSLLLKKHFEEEPDIGVIVIDNYDELMQSIDESGRSQLLAEIDKNVKQWFAFSNGVVRKYERDKYIMFIESKYLDEMQEKKFEILDLVKEIDIGNKLQVTLSMGIASHMKDFATGMKEALGSIELALGRGGDQAVINENGEYKFYGGRSKEIEKRTRVKARVMATALEKLIDQCENVVIMGHKNADMDAIGAAVGISRIAKAYDKPTNIIIDDKNPNMEIVNQRLNDSTEYETLFITPEFCDEYVNSHTLLVVVDTHLSSYVVAPEILNKTKKIFLIDHHRKGAEFIKNTVLTFHEPYASSTCELVVEMLGYLDDKVKIRKCEADCLYAGILLDTQNFSVRTGMRTFEAASYLRKVGMDPAFAKEYIKNSFDDYIKVSEIVRSSEIYKDKIAIAKYYGEEENSVFIAQAADTLIEIKGISAAFVIFKNKNNIAISARSNGTVNVQVLMEKLGGGGHQLIAGAQLTETTVDKTIILIKDLLDELEEL